MSSLTIPNLGSAPYRYMYRKPIVLSELVKNNTVTFLCPYCDFIHEYPWDNLNEKIVSVKSKCHNKKSELKNGFYLKLVEKDTYNLNWFYPMKYYIAIKSDDNDYLEKCYRGSCAVQICPSNIVYQFRHQFFGWLSLCNMHYPKYIPKIMEDIRYAYSDEFQDNIRIDAISPKMLNHPTVKYYDISNKKMKSLNLEKCS